MFSYLLMYCFVRCRDTAFRVRLLDMVTLFFGHGLPCPYSAFAPFPGRPANAFQYRFQYFLIGTAVP